LYAENYLKGEIEYSEKITDGLHGIMDASSNEIENCLEEAIVDEDHSLEVITKSCLEEETLCKA